MPGLFRNQPTPDEPDESDPDSQPMEAEIAAHKVQSGEYFREMQNAYASVYLDSMTDRYFYLLVSVITLLTTLLILGAFLTLFPLREDRPYLYVSNNTWDELPTVRSLKNSAGEDPNVAIRRFLLSEYVIRREAYDIAKLDEYVRFIRANSAADVFESWQKQLDPSSPDSPISLYQRHSRRDISVVSVASAGPGVAEVVFVANITGKEQKSMRFAATIAFQYADVTIDQKTAEASGVKFVVTDYRTRRLQE